jgi:hypothetical protein
VTLTVAATATAALAAPLASNPVSKSAQPDRLMKIALEEHFLVPEFIDYFAETYQNISPEIAKFGLEALQDLGDRQIAIIRRCMRSIQSSGGLCAVGHSRRRLTRCGWSSPEFLNAIPEQPWSSATWEKRSRSTCGASTAGGPFRIEAQ